MKQPTVTVDVVTSEVPIVEIIRAMAAMGQALAARVESHRSAAAANRLGEHKVLLEQSLEDAYRKNAELREKLGEANAKLVTAEESLANVAELQRENAEIRQARASTKIALDDALADAKALRAQLEDLRQIEKERVFFYKHAKQRMHEIEESLGAAARERDEAKRQRDEAEAALAARGAVEQPVEDVASLKLMLGAAMQKAEQARAERDSYMKSNARLLDATSTAGNELRHALEFAEEPVVARGAVVTAYRRLCAVLGVEPKDF